MYRSTTIAVHGHPMNTLIFEPVGPGPHPGLIIAQHLPVAHAGLEKDPFTLDIGERFAAAGFLCAIPFIFHWWPEDEDVTVKREGFRDDWTVADLTATFAYLAGLEAVDEARIGLLGHCWGGRVAWLGACSLPGLKACGVFYGGRVNVAFADGATPPIDLAHHIRCPVLGVFGNEDQNPSPDLVNAYEDALKRAGVPYAIHRYAGAGHGFQDHTNPDRYRQDQSEDAWAKTFAFLEKNLGA
jgi:carboxymethylenebutenolidase